MTKDEFKKVILAVQSKDYNYLSEYCESHSNDRSEFISSFESIVEAGKKHCMAVENTIAEDDVSFADVKKYMEFVSRFLKSNSFVSPLLVKSYPIEKSESFDNKAWATIMKHPLLKDSSIYTKEIALKVAINFGIFENDDDKDQRFSKLLEKFNLIQREGKSLDDYSGVLELDSSFDERIYRLLSNDFENIDKLDIASMKDKIGELDRYVDEKNVENYSKYLGFAKKEKNQLETYLDYYGVSEICRSKYREAWKYMESRIKQSMPEVLGKTKDGYEFEMLGFCDVRALRFGNNENVRCCQHLGGAAESCVINSVSEGSSRVLMIRDELGRNIAGSYVTHTIGKDGRSYVCFDNIEIDSRALPISSKKFLTVLKKIKDIEEKVDKMRKKEDIDVPVDESLFEKIKWYAERTNYKGGISRKELLALEVSERVKAAYQASIDALNETDEKERDAQLAEGVISKEEHDALLLKKGVYTVGKNWSKINLLDYELMDKKERTVLPAITKSKSLYRKTSSITKEKALKKGALALLGTECLLGAGMVAAGMVAPGLVFVTPYIGYKIYEKVKNPHGIYSDASLSQRIIRDGREDVGESVDKKEIERLREKLVYDKKRNFPLVRVGDMTPKQKKDITYLRDSLGLGELGEEEQEKFIIPSNNWYIMMEREDGKVKITDIETITGRVNKRSNRDKDSKEQAIEELKKFYEDAMKSGYSIEIATGNSRVDSFCEKQVESDRKQSRHQQKERCEAMEKDEI